MAKLVCGILAVLFLALGAALLGGWLDPATLEGGALGWLKGPLAWLTDTAGATGGGAALLVLGLLLLVAAAKSGGKDGKKKKP